MPLNTEISIHRFTGRSDVILIISSNSIPNWTAIMNQNVFPCDGPVLPTLWFRALTTVTPTSCCEGTLANDYLADAAVLPCQLMVQNGMNMWVFVVRPVILNSVIPHSVQKCRFC